MLIGSYAFELLPSEVSGLQRAWRPDAGITTGADGITNVAGAWGTSVALTASGTNCPDVGTGLSPKGTDLFEFTSSRTEFFSFTSISLTAFTIAFVVSPKTLTAAMGVLGNSAAATQYMQMSIGTAGSGFDVATRVQIRGGATDVNHDITLPSTINKNLQVIFLTYDGTNTVTPWRDGLVGTPVAIGARTFIFNRIGVEFTATNPINAYLGPVLIWNKALSASEVQLVSAYLMGQWRPNAVYISATGSDSSTTPWKQATPYATYSKAMNLGRSGVAIAPKGGEYIRQTTARISTITAGRSASNRCMVNGGIWGTGKAQIRFSNAPDVTNTAGFIYSLAGTYTSTQIPAGLDALTQGYVYYVPGGVISMSAGVTNVVRLTYQSTDPTNPASGTWAWDSGTGILYVNAGVALSNGDIEVWADSIGTPVLVNPFLITHDNWEIRDVVVSFAEDKGWDVFGRSNVTLTRCDAWFVGSDGFNTHDDGSNLVRNVLMDGCNASYCGRGATAGGPYGDGFSMHETGEVDHVDCASYFCDKSGFNHVHDTVTTHERCFAIGTMPFRHDGLTDNVGSMLVRNSIGVVTAGAIYPHGASNTASVNSPMTVENTTLVSEDGTGNGIYQPNAVSVTDVQNVIVTGFSVGIAGASGTSVLTANHNCLFDNDTDYSNVAAGTGDVLADPKFTDAAAHDFTLESDSPCIGAGVDLGITTDFAGNPRNTPPSIGAYET